MNRGYYVKHIFSSLTSYHETKGQNLLAVCDVSVLMLYVFLFNSEKQLTGGASQSCRL